MVSGHLEVKKGYYYIVLNYVDENGKRHRPWFPTGLPEKGNKRKAEAMLSKVRNSYEPPKVTEEGLLTGFLLAIFGAVQLIRLLRRRGGNEKDGGDE